MRVVRGVLIRFLQAFAVPHAPEIWYYRYLPLVLLAIIIPGAVVAWTVATDALVALVDAWTGQPASTIPAGVNAAVVVAWIALVGLALMLANLLFKPFRQSPLVPVVPATLSSWMAGAAAVAVGLLVGTSIFR